MQDLDDIALLRDYVDRGSEEAFAGIIKRHIDKVYSVALRHTRNPVQAEEITQAVFVILAQKARHLRGGVILSGWLYQTARLASVTFIRGEIRRSHREHEAYMQQNIVTENNPPGWDEIAPLLDTAMAGLNEADRHAVVLRYFDGKSMSEVGGVLGTSEDAAKKRVNRAVEKLQKFFLRRGIDSTAEAITASISSNAVQAAPAALLKTVTTVALAKGAAASGSTLTLIKGTLKTMTWLKIKFMAVASVGVLLAASGVTAIYETQSDSGASAPASTPPMDSANMRLQWQLGKKYSMRVEFTQTTETPVPNQPQPVKSTVNFTFDYNISAVKALDTGGQQLEMEFVNDTLDVTQGGARLMTFDSAQAEDAAHNPARAMIGARVDFFTDADGKVEKVEGVDELLQRISSTGKSEAPAVFKDIFGAENLKRYVTYDGAMPNRTIKIGQNWLVKKDVPTSVGSVAVDVKATFRNWAQRNDHKCAHIESTGNFSTKAASAASGSVMEIKKGRVLGDMWFDPELGMIVSSSADETMTINITTQAATFTPQVTQRIRMLLLGVE